MTNRLRDHFVDGREVPIVASRNLPPIVPTSRWRMLVGVGLTKTFSFEERTRRDQFFVKCLAHETFRKQPDVVWTIEGDDVNVFLRTTALGLTELIVEFAHLLDDLNKDVHDETETEADDVFT